MSGAERNENTSQLLSHPVCNHVCVCVFVSQLFDSRTSILIPNCCLTPSCMRCVRLREPCSGCAAPYGYKHHMKLSKDTSRFVGEVGDTRISGNLDAPEGGFDAVMQSVVCKDKIGWREKSRKLLVFSTDSGFHYAGDGKVCSDLVCFDTRNSNPCL